jgi:hypothetical protein
MPTDQPERIPELSPEEVGARVSEILEAAERDARAIIESAYRELATPAPAGLEELTDEVTTLAARVDALERTLDRQATEGLGERVEAAAERAPGRSGDTAIAAARIRAVELALAGLPRQAIAEELSASMAPGEVERLLDEVLSG